MTVFATAEAWSEVGRKTWRLDETLSALDKTPVRATLFWSAPVRGASLRVAGAAGDSAVPSLARGAVVVSLLPPGFSGLLLEAAAPPEIALFSERPAPPPGFSGAGVFPRCLFAAAAPPAPAAYKPEELDDLLDKGELDEALELFGALCLDEDRDAIAHAARRIALHVAACPLLRTDRVGLFAAALASVRS
jgi:hypothetical protein